MDGPPGSLSRCSVNWSAPAGDILDSCSIGAPQASLHPAHLERSSRDVPQHDLHDLLDTACSASASKRRTPAGSDPVAGAFSQQQDAPTTPAADTTSHHQSAPCAAAGMDAAQLHDSQQLPSGLQQGLQQQQVVQAAGSDENSKKLKFFFLQPQQVQFSEAQLAEAEAYWRARKWRQGYELVMHPLRCSGFSRAVQATPDLLEQHQARLPERLEVEALAQEPDAGIDARTKLRDEENSAMHVAGWLMAQKMCDKPSPPDVSLSASVKGPWPVGGFYPPDGPPCTDAEHWVVLLKQQCVLQMLQQIGAATAPGIDPQAKAGAMDIAYAFYWEALYHSATIQLLLGRDPWAQPSAAAAGKQEVQGSPGAPSDGSSATRRAASNSAAVMQGSAAFTGHAGDTAVEASHLLPAPTAAVQQGKRTREHVGVQAVEGAAVELEGADDDEEVGRALKRCRQAASDKVDRATSSLLPSLLLQQQQDGQPHQGQGEGCASPGQGRTVPAGTGWAPAEKRTAAQEGDSRPAKRHKSAPPPAEVLLAPEPMQP